MNFKLSPLQKNTIFLVIYAAGAFIVNYQPGPPNLLLHLATTVGTGLVLHFILSLITKQKTSANDYQNTIITSLILFLIIQFPLGDNINVNTAIIATSIAILSKFFFTFKGLPIVNPAVFGALAAFYLGHLPKFSPLILSWWGVNFSSNMWTIPGASISFGPSLILMAIWIIFLLKPWRKFPLLISFLIGYLVFFLAIVVPFGELSSPLNQLSFTFTDATIYFLAAVMLVEPKTSPLLKREQIVAGLLAALTYNLAFTLDLEYFDLLAILAANIYFFLVKCSKMPSASQPDQKKDQTL